MMRIRIKRSTDGLSYVLLEDAGNHEDLLVSETYASPSGARVAADRLRDALGGEAAIIDEVANEEKARETREHVIVDEADVNNRLQEEGENV
jgi:uncharacterized protein YegP (UPF0339 family)